MANIKGIKQIQNLLKNLRTESEEAMRKGIRKTAEQVKADALARVPRKNGGLAASAGIEDIENTTKVFFDASYAAFQEFGTGDLTEAPKGYEDYPREFFVNGKGVTPAQPFLFPALFKNEESLKTNVDSEVQKVLDKFGI